MASSVSLGYPMWCDGMDWTSLLSRQFNGGAATWDTNASATAVNPLGGVFHGLGSPLKVTQEASPGMGVLVNAGYCAVPHLTQGHGVYLFGQTAQGTLTVASNSSGSTRVDIVLARVYDLGSSGSSCDVEIVEGTPGSGQPATPGTSILLAAVSVASGASSITNSNITDKRAFTVAPGGILPATSSAVLAPGQVLYNTGTGILERAVAPVSFSDVLGPGSGTWTAPFTGNLTITAYAPGGGGSQSTANQTDGSGGAGECAQQVVAVTESTVYDWAAGFGGDGGSDSAGPTAGTGPATFSGTGIATVTANPGQAGQASAGGGNGDGGTGSSNTVHNPGGAGTTNPSDPPVLGGAGGGGAAGPSGPGSPGSAPDGYRGGAGGAPGTGGGQGGLGGSYGQPGGAGQTPGGGGGQAGDGGGEILNGGDGGDGQLVLAWEITPSALTALGSGDTALDEVLTSTGTSGSSGLSPGSGSSYGWGIGYGSTEYAGFGFFREGFDADGVIAPEIQVQFTADGQTDFQIDAKWGLAVPEAAADASSPSIPNGRCRILIMIDGTVLDTVYLECAASGGVTKPGDAGSFTYYTSAQLGTTPAAGTHTATLAIETQNTLSGQLSGAHVGNLASVSTSTHAFGSVPGYFTSALTAENCYLRVSGIASAI